MAVNEGIRHAQSWSGGKDSTASIVLEHLHRDELKIPPSKVVMAEVMFDNARGISAEYPDHIECVYTKAKPLLESWGHEVEIVRSKRDYITIFHETVKRTIKEDNKARIGKLQGFVMWGLCYARTRMKIPTIEECVKRAGHMPQIMGICPDEYHRLGQIDGVKMRSLLCEYGIMEAETYEILAPFGLLSPYYKRKTRGGCWFCPNQSIKDFAWLKREYPDLWEELERMDETPNRASQFFKYGLTFAQVREMVEKELEKPEQLTLF